MIYLIYGQDDYLKNEFLHKLKKGFGEIRQGINYILLDENSINDLIMNMQTPAFGYEKKMIVIKSSGLFKKKNPNTEKVEEFFQNNSLADLEIIFLEDEVEKNNLYKFIEKEGTIKNFEELKASALVQKVMSIAKAYNVEINGNVAQYFIECCGTNMQDIINEVRKLIEYAGNGGTIQKADIDELTIKKSESIIFDLTDNLGKKNIKKAIDVFHDLLYSKEPAQRILIMLYNHFKKLFIIKISNQNEITQNLKLKQNQMFLINKYQVQSKYFTKEELENLMKEFIYIDEASKNGNIDLELGIESVLCKYCV